ncbi:importin subunit alpha-1-like protein, partial [Trifolium pratense]
VRHALPALQRLILSDDPEVLTDACWALSYISDSTNDKIQEVIDAGASISFSVDPCCSYSGKYCDRK